MVDDPIDYVPENHFIPVVPMSIKHAEEMIFPSIDDAYEFYLSYAKQAGFFVRKGSQYMHDGKIKGKIYTCSKEGYKPCQRFDYAGSIRKGKQKIKKRKKYYIRTGCLAQLALNSSDGITYKVYKFVEEHNHPLVSKDDLHLIRSNRKLSYMQERMIYELSSLNLGPVKAFNVMRKNYGGFENVGATVTECKNFKRDLNCYIGEYDAEMVVRRLLSKKEHLPDYSFEYSVDDSGSLTGLFWADAECKANYLAFGDVISFDATFNTNKYKMVFVPFTGIDNHFRNVTFGAGLISSETSESYKWLLKVFVISFGVQPKVVVTDQDPAMKIAIEFVFTESRHRLCMWHTMKKVADKVGNALCNDESFKKAICNIVWTDSIDPEIFEMEWEEVMNTFELTFNKWLTDIFEMRSMWIPASYRAEMMSGLMRTTSRSESENHFFCQVTNSQMTLLEFFNHYDASVEVQRYNHRKNDHESRYTFPDMWTEFPLEEQAAKIYKRAIFNDEQDEIYTAVDKCLGIKTITAEDTAKLFVKDFEAIGSALFEVTFNNNDVTASCTCKRFERYGLLCRHIFYVFKMFEVHEFPKKYIMKRRTKDAVLNKSNTSALLHDFEDDNAEKVDKVVHEIMCFYEYIINRLAPDLDALCLVRDEMKAMMKRVDEDHRPRVRQTRKERFADVLRANQPTAASTRLPNAIKNKGRGSHKRIKSKKEQAISRACKRTISCHICGLKGHDRRTCTVQEGGGGLAAE